MSNNGKNPFVVRSTGASGAPEGKEIDAAEVRRALLVLADPGGEVELRSIHPLRSAVRLGCDLDGLTAAARGMGAARHVYLCLNPVSLGAPCERSASDQHVPRYRWLFLDIDSIRPRAGENCATESEKTAARQTAGGVRDHLAELGWPGPVEVDSGNGFYLLYRIDLDAQDEASQLLLQALLHALAEEFPGAKIDRSVHNPSRLARLPGTWNKKGKNTPQRPHRMCRLLHVPETVGVVPRELIVLAAGGEPETPAGEKTGETPENNPFKFKATPRLAAYAQAALAREAASVAGAVRGHDGGHGGNNALNEAAFSIGTIMTWEVLDEAEVIDALTDAAESIGLEDAEIGPTIKSGLRAGKKKPRKLPEWAAEEAGAKKGGKTDRQESGSQWAFLFDGEVIAEGTPDEVRESVANPDDDDEGRTVRTFEMSTIGSILATTYPEPEWVVPGIMSEGLNILAGAPKQGKSMLALNLALTVAGGGLAMGSVRVNAADVLYLSLEDKQRRVQDRAVKMLKVIHPDLASEIGDRLVVATEWPRQDEGGLALIDLWASRAEKPGLLIIDVWNRFCPTYKASGNAYSQDADFMGQVKKFAEKRGITALIVHHTRKPGMKEPEDFVNEVSGTLGLAGTADGIMVLMRSRQNAQASLHVTGRDVPESELVLEFDPAHLTWKSLGKRVEHVEGRVQEKVVRYLRENRPTPFFIKEIAEAVEEKPDSVKHACANLLKNRLVRKVGHAFSYPGESVGGGSGDDEGEV